MDRASGFTAFVTARGGALLDLARAMTGDDAVAVDLTEEALARVHQAWYRLDEDPERYAREVLVSEFAGGRKRLVDTGAGLSRRDRAAWALVTRGWLSTGEAAGLLGEPAGTVARAVERADRVLGAAAPRPVAVGAHAASVGAARNAAARPETGVGPSPRTPRAPDVERVARRVRRRASYHRLLVGAVTIALVAGGLLGGLAARRVHQDAGPGPFPGPTVPRPASLDEFAEGGHLRGQTAVQLPARTATLVVTPPTDRIGVGVTCSAGEGRLTARVSLSGTPMGSLVCDRQTRVLPDLPVTPGIRNTVRVSVEPPGIPGLAGGPPSGFLQTGWYEPVPWDRYPFPPRPTTLAPLPPPDPDPAATYLAVADGRIDNGGGSQGPVSRDFQAPAAFVVRASTVVPGRLTVRVNGVTVATFASWGYEPQRFVSPVLETTSAALAAAGVQAGRPATMVVQGAQFAEPEWYAAVEAVGLAGSGG